MRKYCFKQLALSDDPPLVVQQGGQQPIVDRGQVHLGPAPPHLARRQSVLLMLPLASLFLPPGWHAPLHALPTYVIARMVWELQSAGSGWAYGLGRWGLCTGLTVVLLLRLRQRLGTS